LGSGHRFGGGRHWAPGLPPQGSFLSIFFCFSRFFFCSPGGGGARKTRTPGDHRGSDIFCCGWAPRVKSRGGGKGQEKRRLELWGFLGEKKGRRGETGKNGGKKKLTPRIFPRGRGPEVVLFLLEAAPTEKKPFPWCSVLGGGPPWPGAAGFPRGSVFFLFWLLFWPAGGARFKRKGKKGGNHVSGTPPGGAFSPRAVAFKLKKPPNCSLPRFFSKHRPGS